MNKDEVLNLLLQNRRMDRPEMCPVEIYGVMQMCWIKDPNDRPHFSELVEMTTDILKTKADESVSNRLKENLNVIRCVNDSFLFMVYYF